VVVSLCKLPCPTYQMVDCDAALLALSLSLSLSLSFSLSMCVSHSLSLCETSMTRILTQHTGERRSPSVMVRSRTDLKVEHVERRRVYGRGFQLRCCCTVTEFDCWMTTLRQCLAPGRTRVSCLPMTSWQTSTRRGGCCACHCHQWPTTRA
jgi:hypothetical protein